MQFRRGELVDSLLCTECFTSVIENALSDLSLISHHDDERDLAELGCGWVAEMPVKYSDLRLAD